MTKDFITGLNNDTNHRALLWMALEETTSGSVIEFGSGHGSTPYLREYCKKENRIFISYDFNKEWADRMGSTHVTDWNSLNATGAVLFLDHSPGERRKVDLIKYKDVFDIIVIHDTEPTGAGDYQVRPLFTQFKYVVEIPTNGAWVTALSNHIDIMHWDGVEISGYILKAGTQTVTPQTTDAR